MKNRTFFIGDEWLYIKIYGGYGILERLLVDEIYNIVKVSLENKHITNFFFVRYKDEMGPHLRLRFQICDNSLLKLITIINSRFAEYVNDRIVREISVGTYNREIERYGIENIDDVEIIFGENSLLILDGLRYMKTYELMDNRWIFGSKIIDTLLNQFNLTVLEKFKLFEEYYKAYESEFKISAKTKQSLSNIYRRIGSDVYSNIALETIDTNESIKPSSVAITNIILRYDNERQKIIKILKVIIHMHFNRIFISKPRENELVMYFILSKIYKSMIFKNKITC